MGQFVISSQLFEPARLLFVFLRFSLRTERTLEQLEGYAQEMPRSPATVSVRPETVSGSSARSKRCRNPRSPQQAKHKREAASMLLTHLVGEDTHL